MTQEEQDAAIKKLQEQCEVLRNAVNKLGARVKYLEGQDTGKAATSLMDSIFGKGR